jgi:hypothetical protein
MYIGFRSEDLYGEGYSDLKEVVNHEILELENEDITDTLMKSEGLRSKEDVFDYIKEIYKNGFKKCVWLCDSVQDFLDEYDERTIRAEDETWYAMDRWEFRDGEHKLISDMGTAGKLIAYNKRPIVIPIGQVSKSDPRGLLYYGWGHAPTAKRLHYFVNGVSLCMKYQHFGRPQPQSPKPFPLHYFCQTCMRLLCDKIIINGLPVDMAPLRAYVKHLRKRRIENLSAYEYERQRLHDKIFTAAGFRSGNEDYNKARIIYRESDFGEELEHILTRAFACPKCKYSVDREDKCMNCKEFISVEDNLNTLERIADITRRS